jgi:hypothetical protein
MLSRRSILLISTAFLAGGSAPALASFRGNPIKMFDTDADGTLDLDEVKKAAAALFARLAIVQQRFNAAERDNDGTLDAKELDTPAGRALLRLLR